VLVDPYNVVRTLTWEPPAPRAESLVAIDLKDGLAAPSELLPQQQLEAGAPRRTEGKMSRMHQLMQRLMRDESGQGLVEYVLIVALVAVGLILALTVFRNQIGNTFDDINSELQSAPATQYQPAGS